MRHSSFIAHRADLIKAASPVERMPRIAGMLGLKSLLVKREDKVTELFGGSKVRNLERQIPKILESGACTVVIAARSGSNAVAATSLFARKYGLKVRALLKPQVISDTARHNLYLTLSSGAEVVMVPPCTPLGLDSDTVRRQMILLEKEMRKPYFLHFGGGTDEAALAQAEEVIHTFQSIPEKVDKLYVSGASFTLAAGITAGLEYLGLQTTLVIVGVAHPYPPGKDFRRKVDNVKNMLKDEGNHQGTMTHEVAFSFFCAFKKAFGEVTPTLKIEDEKEVAGLELDPVYTRKAFAHLIDDATNCKDQTVMFWHSGNTVRNPLSKAVTVSDSAFDELLISIGDAKE